MGWRFRWVGSLCCCCSGGAGLQCGFTHRTLWHRAVAAPPSAIAPPQLLAPSAHAAGASPLPEPSEAGVDTWLATQPFS